VTPSKACGTRNSISTASCVQSTPSGVTIHLGEQTAAQSVRPGEILTVASFLWLERNKRTRQLCNVTPACTAQSFPFPPPPRKLWLLLVRNPQLLHVFLRRAIWMSPPCNAYAAYQRRMRPPSRAYRPIRCQTFARHDHMCRARRRARSPHHHIRPPQPLKYRRWMFWCASFTHSPQGSVLLTMRHCPRSCESAPCRRAVLQMLLELMSSEPDIWRGRTCKKNVTLAGRHHCIVHCQPLTAARLR
jgi:hypothetical protein